MPNKLYPPIIQDTLPAFCVNYKTENGKSVISSANIKVNFSLNKAVAATEVSGISLRLRTISTNNYVVYDTSKINGTNSGAVALTADLLGGVAQFNLNAQNCQGFEKLQPGQYYKLQIAFIDQSGNIGYFSSIGVIKCIAQPSAIISSYNAGDVNLFTGFVQGQYSQNSNTNDSTEKAYSYRFRLWEDSIDNPLADSGVLLHNSSADTTSSYSTDLWTCNQILEDNISYHLQYEVTSLNGYTVYSPIYTVIKERTLEMEYNLIIHPTVDYDEGRIRLVVKDANDNLIIGNFIIMRQSSKDNYTTWEEVRRVRFNNSISMTIDDYTVEQGVNYKYGIRQYNQQNLYSDIVEASRSINDVEYQNQSFYADFEDMFLYDGKRQLKIRFNPNVSSFKNDLQEQKIDTIGSKYPFIFRNGNVNYREFPISGLISFNTDPQGLFTTDDDKDQMDIDYFIGEENWGGSAPHRDYTPAGKVLLPDANSQFTSQYKKVETIDLSDAMAHIHRYFYMTDTEEFVNVTGLSELQEQYAAGNLYHLLYTESFWGYDPEQKKMRPYSDLEYQQPGSSPSSTDLVSKNIKAERYFKILVLDWLTDGKPKLFRSPTEGNYLVRLMNVSLTPKKELGRMIHEFTATAYEIADCTYDNLIYYGILQKTLAFDKNFQWTTWPLEDNGVDLSNNDWQEVSLKGRILNYLSCVNFAPGDQLELMTEGSAEPLLITIGNPGAYIYSDASPIISMRIKICPNMNTGFSRDVFISNQDYITSKFDTVANITTYTEVGKQFIGPVENVLKATYVSSDSLQDYNGSNLYLINNGEDDYWTNASAKLKIIDLLQLKLKKRLVVPLYLRTENIDPSGINASTEVSFSPYCNGYVNEKSIAVHSNMTDDKLQEEERDTSIQLGDLIDSINLTNIVKDQYCLFELYQYTVPIDGTSPRWQTLDKAGSAARRYLDPVISTSTRLSFCNAIDNTVTLTYDDDSEVVIDLTTIDHITYNNLKLPKSMKLGSGVIANLTYRVQATDFTIENTNAEVVAAKQAYLAARENYLINIQRANIAQSIADYYANQAVRFAKMDQSAMDLQNLLVVIGKQQNLFQQLILIADQQVRDSLMEYFTTYNTLYSYYKEHIEFIIQQADKDLSSTPATTIFNSYFKVIDENDGNDNAWEIFNKFVNNHNLEGLTLEDFNTNPVEEIDYSGYKSIIEAPKRESFGHGGLLGNIAETLASINSALAASDTNQSLDNYITEQTNNIKNNILGERLPGLVYKPLNQTNWTTVYNSLTAASPIQGASESSEYCWSDLFHFGENLILQHSGDIIPSQQDAENKRHSFGENGDDNSAYKLLSNYINILNNQHYSFLSSIWADLKSASINGEAEMVSQMEQLNIFNDKNELNLPNTLTTTGKTKRIFFNDNFKLTGFTIAEDKSDVTCSVLFQWLLTRIEQNLAQNSNATWENITDSNIINDIFNLGSDDSKLVITDQGDTGSLSRQDRVRKKYQLTNQQTTKLINYINAVGAYLQGWRKTHTADLFGSDLIALYNIYKNNTTTTSAESEVKTFIVQLLDNFNSNAMETISQSIDTTQTAALTSLYGSFGYFELKNITTIEEFEFLRNEVFSDKNKVPFYKNPNGTKITSFAALQPNTSVYIKIDGEYILAYQARAILQAINKIKNGANGVDGINQILTNYNKLITDYQEALSNVEEIINEVHTLIVNSSNNINNSDMRSGLLASKAYWEDLYNKINTLYSELESNSPEEWNPSGVYSTLIETYNNTDFSQQDTSTTVEATSQAMAEQYSTEWANRANGYRSAAGSYDLEWENFLNILADTYKTEVKERFS